MSKKFRYAIAGAIIFPIFALAATLAVVGIGYLLAATVQWLDSIVVALGVSWTMVGVIAFLIFYGAYLGAEFSDGKL